jgi:hypothetical protein
MGTGHHYFDEMRSSFDVLGSKSAFCNQQTPLGIASPTLSMLRSTKGAGYYFFKSIPLQYFVVKN